MSNFTTNIRNHKITRFFFPKAIANDVVSKIYVQSFKWTFWTVLILAFIVYSLLRQNGDLYLSAMQTIGKFFAFLARREYQFIEDPEINVLFGFVSLIYATFFFFKNMKKIPPDAWDGGFKEVLILIVIFIGLFLITPVLMGFDHFFETHPDISLANIVCLLFFSYLYAFIVRRQMI